MTKSRIVVEQQLPRESTDRALCHLHWTPDCLLVLVNGQIVLSSPLMSGGCVFDADHSRGTVRTRTFSRLVSWREIPAGIPRFAIRIHRTSNARCHDTGALIALPSFQDFVVPKLPRPSRKFATLPRNIWTSGCFDVALPPSVFPH